MRSYKQSDILDYYVTHTYMVDDCGDEQNGNDSIVDKKLQLFFICRSSLSVSDRDFQAKLRNIKDMFPDLSRNHLEEALIQANGDVEAAIDHVIAQKNGVIQGLSKLVI